MLVCNRVTVCVLFSHGYMLRVVYVQACVYIYLYLSACELICMNVCTYSYMCMYFSVRVCVFGVCMCMGRTFHYLLIARIPICMHKLLHVVV